MTQQLITDVNEVEIAEGDRVESLHLDCDGLLGRIDHITAGGDVYVAWDSDPSVTTCHAPVHVMKVEA